MPTTNSGMISQRGGPTNAPVEGFVKTKGSTTLYPESVMDPIDVTLNDAKRAELELAIQQITDAALSDRMALDQLLVFWNANYEQEIAPRDVPWTNAASLFVPIVPLFVDSILSQLQTMVFVQRFFVVTGTGSETNKIAYQVEQYYNHEMWTQNWMFAFNTCLHLAARDGVGIMEIIWDRTTRKTKRVFRTPRVSRTPLGSIPVIDDDGSPQYDVKTDYFEEKVFDNVRLVPVELRDFFLSPAWSTSIESAVGVGRAMYPTEHELMDMVKGGLLWKDAAERVISFTNTQTTDLSLDRQPINSYTEAGAIAIGAERGGTVSGEVKVIRGPIKIWRYHTREFQISKDGTPEELVLWYHDTSRTLLGVNRYPYWHGKRPFEAVVLMPRPNRFRGFGIPERLQFLQTEANALENQALDRLDQSLQAPMYQLEDVKLVKGEKEWGPGAKFLVPNGASDIGFLTLPQLPVDLHIMKADIELQAQKLMGFVPPTFSAAQAQKDRQSKYEAQVATQNTMVRLQSMAMQVRDFAKRVLVQVNELKKQYGPAELSFSTNKLGTQSDYTITRDMLGADLEFDVSGDVTGPDKGARAQEATVVLQALMNDPLVAQNPQHHYAALRLFLESNGLGNMVVDLIGTEEDAVQMMQQMQQQQQQQQMMQQQQGGKPPQQAGRPPQQQAPMGR